MSFDGKTNQNKTTWNKIHILSQGTSFLLAWELQRVRTLVLSLLHSISLARSMKRAGEFKPAFLQFFCRLLFAAHQIEPEFKGKQTGIKIISFPKFWFWKLTCCRLTFDGPFSGIVNHLEKKIANTRQKGLQNNSGPMLTLLYLLPSSRIRICVYQVTPRQYGAHMWYTQILKSKIQ